MLRLTLLGTGNAAGMPVYGCSCPFCNSANEGKYPRRTPCSALLDVEGKRYLIDAGQVNLHERFPAGSLAGIFVTHFHPDHVQGLFHLRWGKNLDIPVYIPPDSEGCADLYKHPGILRFEAQKKFQTFKLEDLSITPVPLIHSKPTLGYVFQSGAVAIAYLTDTKGLPPATESYLKTIDLKTLVIDCSYLPGHDGKGHNNLDEVLEIKRRLSVPQVVLTHIGHDLDVALSQQQIHLPDGVLAGHDGMQLTF